MTIDGSEIDPIRLNNVAMAPDGSMTWEVYKIQGARLLVNPATDSCPKELATLALTYAKPETSTASHVGSQGSVYREGNIAVKRFHEPSEIECHGSRSLQANICLSLGLSRLGHLTEERYDGIHTFAYSGPDYFAALMPDNLNGSMHPVWLMSYEEGSPATNGDIPLTEKKRADYFSRALGACGLVNIKGVRFDDSDTHNTLSQGTFRESNSILHRLVKFDITRTI